MNHTTPTNKALLTLTGPAATMAMIETTQIHPLWDTNATGKITTAKDVIEQRAKVLDIDVVWIDESTAYAIPDGASLDHAIDEVSKCFNPDTDISAERQIYDELRNIAKAYKIHPVATAADLAVLFSPDKTPPTLEMVRTKTRPSHDGTKLSDVYFTNNSNLS